MAALPFLLQPEIDLALSGLATAATATGIDKFMFETPNKRPKLNHGTPNRKRAYSFDNMPNLRGNLSTGGKSNASTQTSETRKRLRNTSATYGEAKSEGNKEYRRKASAARVAFNMPISDIVNTIAPPWTLKTTGLPENYSWSANQERVVEFLLMDKDFVKLCGNKGLSSDVRTTGGLHTVNISTTPGPPSDYVMDQFKVRFEGGSYQYTFMNVCTNTIHLEFREYKMKGDFYSQGLKVPESPLNLFRNDQYSTSVNLDGFLVGDQPPASNVNPIDDYYLSQWPIASVTNPIGSLRVINEALIPPMKRPQKSSSQLHRHYDLGEKTKVVLKPGDTFVYETRINPFFLPLKQLTSESVDNLIQPYSRIVQVFMRSQFNTDVSNLDHLAPGPGSVTIGLEYKLHWRGVPHVKKNMFIENTDVYTNENGIAGKGGWSTIVNGNAISMALNDIDVEVYNDGTETKEQG